jgi:cardiolipin synthase
MPEDAKDRIGDGAAARLGNDTSSWAEEWCGPQPFFAEAAGQKLTFYPSGADRLDALIAMIDGAEESIRAFYYRFAGDASGALVKNALVRAAKRGVQTVLLIDSFGSDVDADYFQELTKAGGHFDAFMPRWTRRYLVRNHQKLLIVDGKCAMIGGFNISDEYFASPEQNGWHDLGLRIEGSGVEQLYAWSVRLERAAFRPRGHFRAIYRAVRGWSPPQGPAQLLIGGPTRKPSSWLAHLKSDLEKAQQVDLVAAYFAPSIRIRRMLGNLASRGRARFVTAAISDNGATIGATRSLYHYFLGQGAQIWEFQPCKLHMKLLVIDDAVYIGSSNFDVRSLFVNLELMMRLEDADLAERMRAFIAEHQRASRQITPAWYKEHASLWNRLRWNLSWFAVTVLDYNVSRRLNLGL